jgi:hypothetical protein
MVWDIPWETAIWETVCLGLLVPEIFFFSAAWVKKLREITVSTTTKLTIPTFDKSRLIGTSLTQRANAGHHQQLWSVAE